MRAHGQTKLGFYPLPPAEANRLRSWLNFQEPFSTLDPCAGDGVGIRPPASQRPGTSLRHRDRCLPGRAGTNFGDRNSAGKHDGRAMSGGLVVLAVPQSSLRLGSRLLEQPKTRSCLSGPHVSLAQAGRRSALRDSSAAAARLLSEEFEDLRVFRLTEPACLQFKQIVVLGTRRKRHTRLADSALLEHVRWLEGLRLEPDLEPLAERLEPHLLRRQRCPNAPGWLHLDYFRVATIRPEQLRENIRKPTELICRP